MTNLPPEVRQAVESFAPHPMVDRKWHPVPTDGNYDPAATLSATLHTIEMATVSSPMHIALYHKGEYRGQGTPKAGAFISLRHDACTDDTVAVRLKIPGTSHVETRSLHDVEFIWRDGRIFWRGDWPHHAYAPPLPGWSEATG